MPTAENKAAFEATLISKAKEIFGDTVPLGNGKTQKTEDFFKGLKTSEQQFDVFVREAVKITGALEGRAASAVAEVRASGLANDVNIPTLGQAIDDYAARLGQDTITRTVAAQKNVDDKIKFLEGFGEAALPLIPYIKREAEAAKHVTVPAAAPGATAEAPAKDGRSELAGKIVQSAEELLNEKDAKTVKDAPTLEDKLKAYEAVVGNYGKGAKTALEGFKEEAGKLKPTAIVKEEEPKKTDAPDPRDETKLIEAMLADVKRELGDPAYSRVKNAKAEEGKSAIQAKLDELQRYAEETRNDTLGGRAAAVLNKWDEQAREKGLIATADKDPLDAARGLLADAGVVRGADGSANRGQAGGGSRSVA